MKNYKIWIKWIMVLSVALVIAAVLISKCGSKVQEVRTEKTEDKRLTQIQVKFDSAVKAGNTLKDQAYKNHIKDSIARIASNRLISYWKNKALNSRAKVDTIIQANPDLKEAFEDSDSLLAVTESRNKALEVEKGQQWNSFNKILSITEEQLKLQQETTAIISEQRDRYKKKAAKRFVVGPFLGVDIKGKPNGGLAITYRVFRF